MKRWVTVLCFCICFAFSPAQAQEGEAAKANALYHEGKKVDALPLYEDLAKANPKEWLYAERLADCLLAQSAQLSDPAEITAVRTRMRDAAKRAVELGDPAEYVRIMANIDPSAPVEAGPPSAGATLLKEAEKAYAAGDYTTALDKYSAAADADPQLYLAPLFAGDTAYAQKDFRAAAKWFARAIAIDPNRETAYRYWGDSILRSGGSATEARDKFIDAVVAEPYNRLAWQGLQQWAQIEKALLMAPKIDRPSGPFTDSKNPNNITILINPAMTDDKKNPGSSSWMMYSLMRASYHGDLFKKEFPDEKQYRHTLKEEDTALSTVAESVKEKKIQSKKLDESLRNLLELHDAGMLDCWILISAADQGIAQDYDLYRKAHRQLLHAYMDRFVVHGGVSPSE